MNTNKKWSILFVFLVLIVVSLACGSTPDTGTLVSTSESASQDETVAVEISVTEEATQATATENNTAAPQIFTVGDVVDVSDHQIRIVSTEFQANNLLKVEFLIENTGTDSVSISSMLSFSAKTADGIKLEQAYFDCGNSLDGEVLPGDRLRGDICWENAAPGTKVYYEPNLFGSTTIVWKIDESATSDVPSSETSSELQKYHVGDVVKIKDHQITLMDIKFENNKLLATFLIKNLGQDIVSVSSMISFLAKSPDGIKLEQDIFDCGSSLDARVVSGDRLKGEICWSGAIPPITIYYDASLFGSGLIAWEAAETETADVLPSSESDSVVGYSVGETVKVDDHQITLVNSGVQNSSLKATFLIENKGSESINISSLMNFSARNMDGTVLETEYMDCGTSLDGSIVPGDKLQGDVCWKQPGESYKIYYDAELFGETIIVWRIE